MIDELPIRVLSLKDFVRVKDLDFGNQIVALLGSILTAWRTDTIVGLWKSTVNREVNLCGSGGFIEIFVIDPFFAGGSNLFSWHSFANSGSHRGNGQMPGAGLVSVIPQVTVILVLGWRWLEQLLL